MRRLGCIISFHLKACRQAMALTFVLACLACVARLVLLPLLAGQTEADLGSNPLSPLHLGDALLWVLGGCAEVAKPVSGLARANIPELPFHWLVVVLLPTCLLTFLPLGRDGFEQTLVAGGSRRKAWLAAAAAGTLIVLSYWLVVTATCALVTIVLQGSLSFEASEWTARTNPLIPEVLKAGPYDVLVAFLCGVAASVALALVQLALQLEYGTSVAWVTVVVLQLASILFFTPFLPGNLMMLGRSSALVVDHSVVVDETVYHAGFEPWVALAVSSALAVAWLVVAPLRMRRDLLRKD